MLETLFTRPCHLARHRSNPFAVSIDQYLEHCLEQGYPRSSLKKIAWVLMAFSQSLDLSRTNRITRQEIAFAVDHRIRFLRRSEHAQESRSSRLLFIHIATAWLRFLGYLEEDLVEPQPFAHLVDDFADFMAEERGLSAATITFRREQVTHFLDTTWPARGALNAISIQDVNAYLARQGERGWSRRSLHTLADALRSFFRYTQAQGSTGNIAAAITSPRIYAQEGLPLGPRWDEVQQLVECFAGNSAVDLRDRAIVLLLAVYGLRRGEVARLRLEDLDWAGEKLYVTRPKQRCTQQYPLDPVVGDAIVRYLKEARPRCVYRQLFLSLDAPIRPLLPACISPIVRSRLAALGIQIPRRGAHCLRHACARQLLAGGFSLKQIGDHLGHRSAAATREYVKVDLDGLRQVAELNLEALL
jgi:site-specific recombinase XerD